MITKTTIFKNLIGQDEVKRQLSFYADAQNKTGVAPFLMLSGAKGLGKTEFAKQYAEALKNKDKNVYPTLRLVLSAIKDVKIQKKVKEGSLKDEEVIGVLKKMIKQRNESIEVYKKNSRDDLLKIEQNEVDILSAYLPKQFSEEETKKLCASLVSKLEVKSMKDMGKIMGELKKNHSDSIDFSIAGKIIKEILNNQ